jgi:hypothetical protein
MLAERDALPVPVAGIFEAPEAHEGLRESEKDSDRCHKPLSISLGTERLDVLSMSVGAMEDFI